MKSYQYDAVIDIMLAEPGLSLSEVGRRLNKSPSWMSWLTKSDAFRDIYDARRAQKNQIVSDELNNALVKVARQSLDIVSERMEKNPSSVSLAAALEVADKSLERLGYGVKLPGVVVDARSQQSNSFVLSAEEFERAQNVVRGLEDDNSSQRKIRAPSAIAEPIQTAKQRVDELLASAGFSWRSDVVDIEPEDE